MRTTRADAQVLSVGSGDVRVRAASPGRHALRLVVAASYVGALFVAVQLAGLGGVTDEPAQVEPVEAAPVVAEPPPRPEAVPNRIPEWAWGLSLWHDDRLGNVRPLEAPQTVPGWYWEWRAWRKELGP